MLYPSPGELRSRKRCEELLAVKVGEFVESCTEDAASRASKRHHNLNR